MHNNAVNSDEFFVRFAHKKCAGYGWRYALMKMNHLVFKIIALLLISPLSIAEQSQEEFLVGYISGKYHLVGKSVDSQEAYYGKVQLVAKDNNEIEVLRTIAGKTVVGVGAIEKATPDKINVLRIRFEEKNSEFEETCMIDGDLGNYARITCYLYQPGVRTNNPGLEALFIDHGES